MSLIELIRDKSRPPAIVAELSGNHHQDFDTAKRLIELAASNGADAVKLQTYTADTLTLPSSNPEFIVKGGLWDGRSLYELYQEAATPYQWHAPLAKVAKSCGISLFSTPFDEAAVDFLEETIAPELYKVSSFELTHLPLLKRIAETAKPVIMSTGMAALDEIESAADTLARHGAEEVILLKCVNEYPSRADTFNLASMPAMGERFDCKVGLSDHSLGTEVALAATALGARLIEKHFTDDRQAGGIDAAFSMEPRELEELSNRIKVVHSSLGSSNLAKTPLDAAQRHYRRSVYISKDVAKGEMLTPENVKIVRPSLGLPPSNWERVLNRKATRNLKANTPLQGSDFD